MNQPTIAIDGRPGGPTSGSGVRVCPGALAPAPAVAAPSRPRLGASGSRRERLVRRLAGALTARVSPILNRMCAGTAAAALSMLAALAALAGPVLAQSPTPTAPPPASALSAPSGPVMLTITGRVSRGQSPGEARFDRELLAALPQHRIETTTPWSQGRRVYEGPLLRDVLAAAGADGRRLIARALNDYSSPIPRSDADELGLLLAMRVDGQPIRIRDNGPLLLIYPFDQRPELRTQVHYGRSVWQLNTIAVGE